MMSKKSRTDVRVKKHRRLRNYLSGTSERPRLAVFRSNNHMYAQIIDDTVGNTLVAASTLDKDVKAELDKYGLFAEFVAPRLWFDKRTNDGGFTASLKSDRDFAMWRAQRSCDIAGALGTNKIQLWLAREGTLCAESKDPVQKIGQLIDSIDDMLTYDDKIKVLIESKPNEPIDRSYCGTIGHVMAVSAASKDPKRVGAVLESAHAILAGLDPAHEMAFAREVSNKIVFMDQGIILEEGHPDNILTNPIPILQI